MIVFTTVPAPFSYFFRILIFISMLSWGVYFSLSSKICLFDQNRYINSFHKQSKRRSFILFSLSLFLAISIIRFDSWLFDYLSSIFKSILSYFSFIIFVVSRKSNIHCMLSLSSSSSSLVIIIIIIIMIAIDIRIRGKTALISFFLFFCRLSSNGIDNNVYLCLVFNNSNKYTFLVCMCVCISLTIVDLWPVVVVTEEEEKKKKKKISSQ